MGIIKISKSTRIPKYKQIVVSIENAIATGRLKKGDALPSLNEIKNKYALSRDTVVNAFNNLKSRGIIQSVVGKGYYVLNTNINSIVKIFVLFDELNSFKEDLYNAFINTISEDFIVDIYFHHFNFSVFSKIIQQNKGNYSHYVIMPANFEDAASVIENLPKDKVFILDQTNETLNDYPAVFQNFKKDIFEGLKSGLPQIKKYKKLYLYFNHKQPLGLIDGFTWFCNTYNLPYELIKENDDFQLHKGDLYIILDDKNLIKLIKKVKEQAFIITKDVGVISYNDHLLKEIIEGGITTISSNFKNMGTVLANMIINNTPAKYENPNQLILRNSL